MAKKVADRSAEGAVLFSKQRAAYEISACLVGSGMCMRGRGGSEMRTRLAREVYWINYTGNFLT